MPLLKKPFLSFGAVGRLGKHFTIRRRKKDHILERRPIPTDAKSPVQLIWRTMYQACTSLWHNLSEAEQQAWESAARPLHMTGYAWFISQCLRPNPGIYLPLAGGTMAGDIDMDTFRILKLPAPLVDQEAATKKYVDDAAGAAPHAENHEYGGSDEINLAALDGEPFTLTAHKALTTGVHGLALGARVYPSVPQAIADATWTIVAFDSENYDTDTIHDPITNNSRLTCKTAGKYIIGANIRMEANATGDRNVRLRPNGAGEIAHATFQYCSAVAPIRLVVVTVYNLAVNNYIEVEVYQSRGNSLNVDALTTQFWMQRVG